MGKVHVLKSIQRLPVPPDHAWKFFSDPGNLLTITPPFLNLKKTNILFGDEVYAGQVMTYTVKPLFGIPLSWMTEITHVDKGKYFVDEQRKGPYALWHHQHHFKLIDGGTEMTDLVHYRLPFGVIGNRANFIVKRQLVKIFEFRFQKITEIFGPWPGERLLIEIN